MRAGVQVFQQSDFTTNPCGSGTQNVIEFPLRNGESANLVTSVQGMQFLPAPQGVSVGAAVEHQGAEFFNLSDLSSSAIDGCCRLGVPHQAKTTQCGTT